MILKIKASFILDEYETFKLIKFGKASINWIKKDSGQDNELKFKIVTFSFQTKAFCG